MLLDGITMLKNAAAYTAGDLYALLSLCRTNGFLAQIDSGPDLPAAWKKAAEAFFTSRTDRALAVSFIEGFGRTDLDGQLAYMTLFEQKTNAALEAARRDSGTKCKLYTMLGVFAGTVTAILLV